LLLDRPQVAPDSYLPTIEPSNFTCLQLMPGL